MALSLPLPVIEIYDGVQVVNDTEAGTKFRMAIAAINKSTSEVFNFASSTRGESPRAMAKACQILGRKLNLFYPETKEYTSQMEDCAALGATIKTFEGLIDEKLEDFIYLQAEAKRHDGEFITFNNSPSEDIITDVARELGIKPDHVWAAGGLGGITRGLQKAWPDAQHYAVEVNPKLGSNFGKAHIISLDADFNTAASAKPPFPCNAYFEAKAWAALQAHRGDQQNIVFWNPACL